MNSFFDFNYLQLQKRSPIFSLPNILGKKVYYLSSYHTGTGWGKITSLNFKVNNKKKIRDTNILFLDSETTTWEVLNYIVLKRISWKWWPLFAWCLRAEALGDCKTDRLTASMFSGVREVRGRPHPFLDTLPTSLKFSTQNRMDFRSGTRSRGGVLVASTERTLHRYDRVTLRKVGFDGKCALLVAPHHLYDCGVL